MLRFIIKEEKILCNFILVVFSTYVAKYNIFFTLTPSLKYYSDH